MAEKPVIVPVELQVTDLNLEESDLRSISNDINKRLSGVAKSVSDLFGKIDASKMGKSIASAMTKVENSVLKALQAEDNFRQAIKASGESSAEYKDKLDELDGAYQKLQELKDIKSLWEDSSGKFAGGDINAYNKAVAEYENQIRRIRQLESEAKPEEFALVGSDKAVEKMAIAYRKVCESIAQANREQMAFNQAVEDGKVTDEFQQYQNNAEELRNKLEQLNEKSKKMSELGATDRQWESLQYDTKQVSSELDSILRKMREMVKDGSAFNFDPAEEDIKNISTQIKSINASRLNIAGSGKSRVGSIGARARANMSPYTEDYKTQLNELEKLETATSKLVEKYERMKALGKDSPEGLKAAEYDAQQLSGKLDEVRQKLIDMVNSGQAFRFGNGDVQAEISGVNSRVQDTQHNLNSINGGMSKVSAFLHKLLSAGAKVGQVLGKGLALAAKGAVTLARGLGRVASRLASILKSAAGAIKNLQIFHKTGSSTSTDLGKKFKKLQKNILMFGFGFRSAYYAVKRLRNIFISAFKTLATQSEEVNDQISRVVMTLNKLKGSLATAFQPIVSTLIPVVNLLMDKLSGAMEVIGKFFATLTGQNYIYKATANQYDFAESLDNTGKSAEEAEKKLGSYDKLDVISDDKDKSSSTSGLLDVTYEKASVEGAVSDFAQLLKDSWQKQDFTQVGEVVTQKILGLLDSVRQNSLPALLEFVNKLTDSLVTFLNSFDISSIGTNIATKFNDILSNIDPEAIGQILANLQSLFWQFLEGLTNELDWGQVGEDISGFITGWIDKFDINAVLNSIVNLMNGIGTAIVQAIPNIDWANIGTTFGNAVANFIENIDFNTIVTAITQLAGGISTALFNFVQQIDFKKVADDFATGLNTMFADADGKNFEGGLSSLVSGIVQFATTLFTNIDWTQLYENLKTGIDNMLTALSTALGNSDNPVVSTIGDIISTIQTLLQGLWPIIEMLVTAIMPIVQMILPIISTLLPPILEILNMAIDTVLPVILSILDAILPVMQEFISNILPMLQPLLEALQPVFDVLVNTLLPVIVDIMSRIFPLTERILQVVIDLLVPIIDLIAPLLELVTAILDPLFEILEPILDLVVFLCEILGMILKPIIQLLSPLIKLLTAILEPIMDVLTLIFSALTPFIDILKFVAGVVANVLTVPLNILIGVFDVLAAVVKKIAEVFRKAFDKVKTQFESVWNFIKGIINAILGGIEAMANGVIRGVNTMIRGLNKISFDIPEWIPGIGGTKFGFNIKEISEVHIPRLAQGAIIPPNKEFLAMLGDQSSGTNIEAPLDTIKQALAEVLAELGSAGHEPIILQIDGKTVAKVVWAENEKRYKQTGKAYAY